MNLKESVYYQMILREGRVEGAIEKLHNIILRLGRRRFGAPSAETEAVLSAILDTDRLDRLADRIFDAVTWEDLLATE